MFDLFHLVTWDDLDLYYGHKAQEMILTDVSDTIHADSLALFELNIEILLADVAKPEKSKILTLTWPVTSSVTSGSNIWPCTGSSRTGLSNGVWNLEIGPVVWEISGGGPLGPPPAGRVTNQTPAGRGLTLTPLGGVGVGVGGKGPTLWFFADSSSSRYWEVHRYCFVLLLKYCFEICGTSSGNNSAYVDKK